jgi:hypothetical protein
LHPKFYKRIFFWDVKSTPNYSEKFILAGIDIVTLNKYFLKLEELFEAQVIHKQGVEHGMDLGELSKNVGGL